MNTPPRFHKLFVLLFLSPCLPLTAGELPDLRVSENGHFLETVEGTPFFWTGDTGWTLFQKSPEDIETYLQDRKEKRFNVIQTMALRTKKGDPPTFYRNYAGEVPLTSTNPVELNEAYWRHIDYLVETAAEKGLYVVLFTMWGPDADTLFPNPAEDNFQYGQLLGERYKNASNVMFAVCGEFQKVRFFWANGDRIDNGPLKPEQLGLVERIAEGLEAGHKGQRLMTIHPDGGMSSSDYFHNAPWLDFNMQQSFGLDSNLRMDLREISEDFYRLPAKPVLNGEPGYENRDYKDPCPARKLRLEAYWSVFSGGFGFTYGAEPLWRFEEGWEDCLDYEAADDMRHLRALMESRPQRDRVAEFSLITGGRGWPGAQNQNYAVACRAADGGHAFVYKPYGQEFVLDLSEVFDEPVNAWWYNPRDGACYDANGTPTDKPFAQYDPAIVKFSPPGPEGPNYDWVLVLDSAGRGYSKPGLAPTVE